MVKRSPSPSDSSRRPRAVDTTLGPASTFRGELHADGDVFCAGSIEGNLTCSGDLVLAPTSVVKGDIRAMNVTVGGRVEGNVTAEGLLTVQATGVITGRIAMARLVVDEGAYLRGDCLTEPARTES